MLRTTCFVMSMVLFASNVCPTLSFAPTRPTRPIAIQLPQQPQASQAKWVSSPSVRTNVSLKQYNDNEASIGLSSSDQGILGGLGTVAALITLVSEYTLKMTGCGLPAGPLGLIGFAEGISYLTVFGVGSFSLYTKVKSGNGLPAGPGGLLGAAEGLSFLAILAGIVVLVLQITNYGYIPNAVPLEGGMCS